MNNEKLNESNENEKLTIEQLRKFEGLEDITNDEAKDMSDIIYELSKLIYNSEFTN